MIERFNKVFGYNGYLDYFKDEGIKKPEILIHDPSRICGIVYTDKLLKLMIEDSGWKTYFYNGFKPVKKETNYVLFEGYFYSCDFFLWIFNEFLKGKDIFEIRSCGVPEHDYHAILIKIDSEFSIGITNLLGSSIREDKEGVLFVDTELEGDDFVEKDTHYVEWENGIARYSDWSFGKEWKKVVYNQDYLFDKVEKEGDSLLI